MDRSEETDVDVTFGTEIYDQKGNRLGAVRGFDEHGFFVSTDDGITALSGEHISSGIAGEAELTWRCYECGAIGDIEELPEDGCPDCGAPQEDIYYHLQD